MGWYEALFLFPPSRHVSVPCVVFALLFIDSLDNLLSSFSGVWRDLSICCIISTPFCSASVDSINFFPEAVWKPPNLIIFSFFFAFPCSDNSWRVGNVAFSNDKGSPFSSSFQTFRSSKLSTWCIILATLFKASSDSCKFFPEAVWRAGIPLLLILFSQAEWKRPTFETNEDVSLTLSKCSSDESFKRISQMLSSFLHLPANKEFFLVLTAVIGILRNPPELWPSLLRLLSVTKVVLLNTAASDIGADLGHWVLKPSWPPMLPLKNCGPLESGVGFFTSATILILWFSSVIVFKESRRFRLQSFSKSSSSESL